MIKTNSGLQVLLDCGMYQGRDQGKGSANRRFAFDPSALTMVVLSHAHIDHSGLLPRLVKEGFAGPIYCTEPTRMLCEIMLADSAHIQQTDFGFRQKHQISDDAEEPLYGIEDVVQCMSQFRTLSYGSWHHLQSDVTLMFTYVGHIIGSACVNLRIREGRKTHRIAYTGDIGRRKQQIIKGWEPFPQSEVIITESTYGDRLHEDGGNTIEHLHKVVHQTCVVQKGKLIIPAFSLGRTQEIVHALDKLESQGRLPSIKVFVDSPLSTNATDIVKAFPEHYNSELLKYMERDSNPFGFATLHYIRDVKYSKLINTLNEPCIIISASGMAEAGRVVHHLANNIENERNTVLIVGYCEPGTLGERLRSGAKQVKILGRELQVKARVQVMDSYSAHGDYLEMIEYLRCQQPHLVSRIFLVHGQYERQVAYSAHLTKAGFHHIEIPDHGHVAEL